MDLGARDNPPQLTRATMSSAPVPPAVVVQVAGGTAATLVLTVARSGPRLATQIGPLAACWV